MSQRHDLYKVTFYDSIKTRNYLVHFAAKDAQTVMKRVEETIEKFPELVFKKLEIQYKVIVLK